MDDKLRVRRRTQLAEDVSVAPAHPELLASELRVAPTQPVAEHARRLSDVDGGKPPVTKEGLPAGGKDPSSHCAR